MARIVIGYTRDDTPVCAGQIQAAGAMAALGTNNAIVGFCAGVNMTGGSNTAMGATGSRFDNPYCLRRMAVEGKIPFEDECIAAGA